MVNKQHELVLKAFLETTIPKPIKLYSPSLLLIDSALGGYCTRVLQGDHVIHISTVISAKEKEQFSNLINNSEDNDKAELVIYYRLAILTEYVLLNYYSLGIIIML